VYLSFITANAFLMRYGRLFFMLFLVVSSCHTPYSSQSVLYNNYAISAKQQETDTTLSAFLRPYADSVNSKMNEVIGFIEASLEKQQPEGTLGNIMADALLFQARSKFGVPVEVAMMNSGGVRLNQLPGGPLTKGKVYELMPFDNLLVIQQLTGSQLQVLLNHVANRGGWPIAGASFIIKDKTATQVLINGIPLENQKNYLVANTDYIVNGGDNVEILKTIQQTNKGYLIRDALIEYFSSFKKKGEPIRSKLENRITNAQ
jgi:2',3'-cyclic-nucleotide 2'-phosphodiesterase (5'-nucleotidase family)